MRKDNKKHKMKKEFLNENIIEKFDELENMDDLWYFVKSNKSSWVAGSAD